MKHNFSSLFPKPGREEIKREKSNSSKDVMESDIVGKHCILELYGCDQSKLNDETFVRQSVISASQIAGATLLKLIIHTFDPQGVTCLALLAESHMSIHTWPESRYAAIDVFTCGTQTVPENACKFLAKEFCANKYSLKSFSRQTEVQIRSSKRNPKLLLSN